MAAAPYLKVYDSNGRYQSACHEVCAAAALMGLYGDGSTIRMGHAKKNIAWTEGAEDQPATESYDFVADVIQRRFPNSHVV